MKITSLSGSPALGLAARDFFLLVLSDLRTTLLWITPSVILFSTLLFIVMLIDHYAGDGDRFALWVPGFYQQAQTFFSYLLTAALTFTISMRLKQPRPTLVLLSLCFLAVYQFLAQLYSAGIGLQNLMAIITPLYTVPLLAFLRRGKPLGRHQLPNSSRHLTEAVNMIMPSIAVLLVVLSVDSIVLMSLSAPGPFAVTLEDIDQAPYWYASLFSLISALSHFFGVHSFYTLSFLHDPLAEALSFNAQSHLQSAGELHLLDWTTAPVFSLLGGAGSTLALVIAILLASRQKTLRTIALISLPLSLFNVNEILVFAIPIIFNPILLAPFLLAPTVNICISLFAMQLGLVSHSVVSVPFISPIFFNGYMATDGDVNAVILQLLCLGVSSCIYLPFIKPLDKMHAGKSISISNLDTYYSRKREEAIQINDTTLSKVTHQRKQANELEEELRLVSGVEFFLEYQPQVTSVTNSVIAAEALIRASDGKGNTYLPGAFLPCLEKAGLMSDVDLWVVNQAIDDIRTLKKQGCNIPISVNLTAETLLDDRAMDRILEKLQQPDLYGHFNIEITETTLLQKNSVIASAFERFHTLGFNIHIDDFGTGYSSLSYLPDFDIDKIKIDRSFINNTKSMKGRNLLLVLLEVAASQGMDVVVEGVETKEQLQLIPINSTISMQGTLFSRSLGLDDFMRFYTENTA